MKSCLAGLLLILGASALGGPPRTRWDIAPVFKVGLPSAPLVVQPVITTGLNSPTLFRAPFRCGCRFGRGFGARVSLFENPPRASVLKDPVVAIGAAYLQSRSVKAALLDPEFPVADYREGYFGSWVEDGRLVRERAEFTDEAAIRRVFALLVEAVGEPDKEELWLNEPSCETSVTGYRRISGFVPEVSFEFVGGISLRVEFNTKLQRLLIQAGDRWDIYALDRWTAAALKELLMAQATAGTSPVR